ncbi:MAG: hypothetical protein F7C38_08140 [Desulfurococcales archaeon]|nr:hypothetical protein [Desulfurococcales archaeon]
MSKTSGNVKVTIKWFISDKKTYGPVEIGVLRPGREYESVEVGSPIEILLNVIEKSTKSREGDYFEVTVEAPGIIEVMGESPKYRSQRMLFPRPARLVRVGILRSERIGSLPSVSGDYIVFKRDDLEWYEEGEEVYVYEGSLQASEDVVLVYIETALGPRILIPPGREKFLRDALSHTLSSAE